MDTRGDRLTFFKTTRRKPLQLTVQSSQVHLLAQPKSPAVRVGRDEVSRAQVLLQLVQSKEPLLGCNLSEQGTGLEGQPQGWKAAQVISGSCARGKLKIQSHFPARLGKDKQIKCRFKFAGQNSSCLDVPQNQVNKFSQPMARCRSHHMVGRWYSSDSCSSLNCTTRQESPALFGNIQGSYLFDT